MHGINIENKGFTTLTDYVRVRYVPSASEHAVKGKTYKGVYWNGHCHWEEGKNLSAVFQNADCTVACATEGFKIIKNSTWTALASRTTAGALMEGDIKITGIDSTSSDSTYAHTLYF